jgi:hypothetical protein
MAKIAEEIYGYQRSKMKAMAKIESENEIKAAVITVKTKRRKCVA